MNLLKQIWNNIDQYLTIVVAVILTILSLTDSTKQPSLEPLILGVMALLAFNNLRNRFKINEIAKNQFDSINAFSDIVARGNDNIIQALHGVSVATFESLHEYSHYKAKRLRRARRVDDVTWRHHGLDTQTRSQMEIKATQDLDNIVRDIVKKPGVIWREVAMFKSKEHLEQELSLIRDPDNIGYNFGFYPSVSSSNQIPPRVGFMIIDSEELFIGYASNAKWLVIRHPEIIAVYSAYFNDLWKYAEKVKVGNQIDDKKVETERGVYR